jgi:hypothetical protein
MTSYFKPLIAATLVAAGMTAPVSAQNYYGSLNGSDGCLIDIGRTAPSNSYYDYSYTISNRCEGRYFKVYYTVNGRSLQTTIGYGLDFKYDLKNSDKFQITAVEE